MRGSVVAAAPHSAFTSKDAFIYFSTKQLIKRRTIYYNIYATKFWEKYINAWKEQLISRDSIYTCESSLCSFAKAPKLSVTDWPFASWPKVFDLVPELGLEQKLGEGSSTKAVQTIKKKKVATRHSIVSSPNGTYYIRWCVPAVNQTN